jgi:hypothetical protein
MTYAGNSVIRRMLGHTMAPESVDSNRHYLKWCQNPIMELGIFSNPTVTVVNIRCVDVLIRHIRQDMEPLL